MTQIRNKIVAFSLKLLLILAIAFPVHAYCQSALGLAYFHNLLIESYLANYILVVVSYSVLLKLQKKYTNSLGFIFMGGSFVKFAVFFIFFNPYYKSDEDIQTVEFLAFFIPYGLAIILETISLVRLLNKAD